MSHDVALVTWNEKGFWQAALYKGAGSWDREDWNGCPEPDDSFTMGKSADDAANRACEKWPKAEIQLLAPPDFAIGSVVRTGMGPTALMEITSFSGSRAYGDHVLGGSVGAEVSALRPPSDDDMKLWHRECSRGK